jgi:membrane protein
VSRIERIILNWKPVNFVVQKSKHIILPGFANVPLYDVVVFFFQQINKVGLHDRAAAISFNFVMAIPAASICLLTLIPYMPISEQVTAELLRITRIVSGNQDIYNMVNGFLEDFLNTPRVGLLSFGFLLVVYYSSNAMLAVMRTFDLSIYQHSKKKHFLQKRWKAVRLTVILFGIIIGVILLLVGQGVVFQKIMGWLGIKGAGVIVAQSLKFLLTFGLFFYSISFIYKYATSVTKRWHTFSPGSILTTALTILTTISFSYWVNNFSNYNKVYGSIGTALLFMLLIYLNSLILIIGFELNVSITYLRAEAEERLQNEMNGLTEPEVFPKLNH